MSTLVIDPVTKLTIIGLGSDSDLVKTIHGHFADTGASVTELISLSKGNNGLAAAACFDLKGSFDSADLPLVIRQALEAQKVDFVFQRQSPLPIRLACFDMDSTLIQIEVIDELAKYAKVGDKVAAITESAMQGHLDFNQSFTERMRLLKGLDASVIDSIIQTLPLMDGAERLFKNLSKHKIHTAILSGGFEVFAKNLQEQFDVDTVVANTLEVDHEALTGRVIAPIVNADIKREQLELLQKDLGLEPEQTLAVGDGANDLLMLDAAHLGIAFRAKPLVQQKANAALNYHGLDAILFLLGLNQDDIVI